VARSIALMKPIGLRGWAVVNFAFASAISLLL
jgi:hypothetical protein